MIELAWGAATHVGHVRQLNEDSYRTGPPAWIVADGMGGHAAGDVASRLAVQAWEAFEAPLAPGDVAATVRAGNEALLEWSQAHPGTAGMGTTLTGVVLTDVGTEVHWTVLNVGDSRVYRCVEGVTHQVSIDHSEVQELVDAGELTPGEAERDPRRNIVTRSLGMRRPPVVDMWVFPPIPGERLLVCSDGLTKECSFGQISAGLALGEGPQAVADALVAAALDGGGRDNVTVLVVEVLAVDVAPDETTVPRLKT